jgi:hypothetical protein
MGDGRCVLARVAPAARHFTAPRSSRPVSR